MLSWKPSFDPQQVSQSWVWFCICNPQHWELRKWQVPGLADGSLNWWETLPHKVIRSWWGTYLLWFWSIHARIHTLYVRMHTYTNIPRIRILNKKIWMKSGYWHKLEHYQLQLSSPDYSPNTAILTLFTQALVDCFPLIYQHVNLNNVIQDGLCLLCSGTVKFIVTLL